MDFKALRATPPPAKVAWDKGLIGFTLAEVLITIGIIGVVAALTLPSLINNYRRNELRTRFKKASSTIEQAVLSTAVEFGMENYLLPGKKYIANMGTISENDRNEMNDYFLSQLKYVNTLSGYSPSKVNSVKIYKKDGSYYNTYPILGYPKYKFYVLQDGTTFAPMVFQHHHTSDGIKVYFDTNGPFKGPNRIGYDLFIYDTGYWCHNMCSTDIGGGNFIWYGCYEFAQSDQDPDDKTKGYWDSLKL